MLMLIVDHRHEIVIGIAVVGDGACQNDFEVESADSFAVQVDIPCDGHFLLGHGEGGDGFLKLLHDLDAARHTLDVAVYLPPHLCTHKLVDLP